MAEKSGVSQRAPQNVRWKLAFPVTALIAVSMVSNVLLLAGPLFMLQIYDRVLTSRSVPTLFVLTTLMCAVYAYYALLEFLRARMSTRAANLIDVTLGNRLFAASVQYRLVPGALGSVDPVREGDVLRAFAASTGPLALLDLPWMPVYLAIVFLIHPMLGWLAVGGSLTIVFLAVINEFLARSPTRKVNFLQGMRQRNVDNARSNAEAIVGMGMLADIQRGHHRLNDSLLGIQQTASDRTAFFSSAIKGLRFLLQSVVLALGAFLVIGGEMTAGLMIAASIITSRALAPVDQIVGQWRGFVAARQAYGRIRKILAAPMPQARGTLLPLSVKSLTVNQLATAPAGSRVPVVSGVNFELTAGDGLGVLGPSGAGKSSLARALVGIWPSLMGDVRFDGALLEHFDPSQVGQIIGYLPQRVELFEGTVAENIARFRSDASSENVIAAAKAANIHALINSLPNGYDTHIGEHGELLSAGQRQQIGLARALYGEPFLVLLDEPNANLDSDGDAALAEAVKGVRARGGIAIVIAHRPSAIGAVDKILLIQNGRQTNFGPKSEVFRQVNPPSAHDKVHSIKVVSP